MEEDKQIVLQSQPQEPSESDMGVVEPIIAPVTIDLPTPKFEMNKEQSFEDQAKDYVMAAATVGAIKDGDTKEAVLEKKSDEMVTHAEVKRKREKVEEKKAEIDLQDAGHKLHIGIAKKAGIKDTLPTWMQKSLFPVLGIFLWIGYLIIGGLGGILSIFFDVINTLAEQFVNLTELAKKLFWTVFGAVVVLIILAIVSAYLERFGIHILPWQK